MITRRDLREHRSDLDRIVEALRFGLVGEEATPFHVGEAIKAVERAVAELDLAIVDAARDPGAPCSHSELVLDDGTEHAARCRACGRAFVVRRGVWSETDE